MTHGEQLVTTRAVISLAGPMAQGRLYRVSEPGWVPLRPTRQRELAVHEAGHAIAGLAFGQCVQQISIAPDPGLRSAKRNHQVAGYCAIVASPEQVPDLSGDLDTDSQTIARLAILLTPADSRPIWKAARRVIRSLRLITDAVLDCHWPRVLELAAVLERNKFMTHPDVQVHLKRMGASFPAVSLTRLHRRDLALTSTELFQQRFISATT